MLRDRYSINQVFDEIVHLVPKMAPTLAAINQYLDDEHLIGFIKADLSKRYPQTMQAGRNSTPVEVVLRMLVIKRLYGYSYEEAERYVSDSLVFRQFCRIYLNPVPDDTTLIKWANMVQDKTLQMFNERITQLALEEKITQGHKLRTDGTVVAGNIHLPSDSRQLADSVRVLDRTVDRFRKIPHTVNIPGEDFTQAARRTARKIGEIL